MDGRETVVCVGESIKALGNGKWRGYLVRYGSPDQTDISPMRDFFTKQTDFDWADGEEQRTGTVYYHHGLDPVLKTRKLGKATLGKDEFGIWAEGQLALRDQYEQFIYQQIEAGNMGLSSGTLPNLVARKAAPNQSHEITHWPLGLDVSITPTPAEARNRVVALKMLDARLEATAEGQVPATATAMPVGMTQSSLKNEDMTSMNENEEKPTELTAEPIDVAAIAKQAADEAIKAYEAKAPAIKSAGLAGMKSDEPAADESAVKSAFTAYVRTGAIKAAMQVGTASEGGYLVPQTYSNELIRAMTEESVLRAAGARIIPISGTQGFKVPTLTNSSAATLTAEEAAFNEAEATVGEITFVPNKYTKLVKVSDELLDDSRIDVTSQILVPDAAQAFAAAENSAFVSGTGAGQPQGILTGASLGKTAASATAITFDEIYDLIGSVFYGYRKNAKFLMNDATLTAVRKLKDSTGQYLWQPSNQAGVPDKLAGYPVYVLNTMPTIATGNKTILFGDFNYFWIADIGSMAMQRLNELYAVQGQVGFRWFKRVDSRVMLSSAIKYLQQA